MKKIGIIGYGGIANGYHVPGYREIPQEAQVYAVCDIREDRLQLAKETLGIPDERLFTDYNALINSGLVDAIDICTSNDAHCKIAQAAVKAGLPYSVEKPVGLDFAEAKDLFENTQKNEIPSFVCFSWRYRTYTRYLRDIVKSGALGELYHISVRAIKESGLIEGRPLEWRFEKEKAGSGVLGDLASHMIDIVRFWGEEFDGVFAQHGIRIHERPLLDGSGTGSVTTDDWCNINAMSKSGVPITIQVSRVAKTIEELTEFEVIGSGGRIKFTYDNGRQDIEICVGDIDTKAKGTHHIVPPNGYEGNQSKSFVDMLNGKKDEYTSELAEGIACQKVLEAALISAEEKRYVKISEIK